jgi:hypothetical protein
MVRERSRVQSSLAAPAFALAYYGQYAPISDFQKGYDHDLP